MLRSDAKTEACLTPNRACAAQSGCRASDAISKCRFRTESLPSCAAILFYWFAFRPVRWPIGVCCLICRVAGNLGASLHFSGYRVSQGLR